MNTSAPGGTLHDDHDPSPMHIFDIRRSPDVLKTWTDIHSKTHSESVSNAVRMFFGEDVGSDDTAAPNCNPGASLLDSAVDVTSTQTNDLFGVRSRWVQRCDPPQLRIAVPAPKAEDDAPDGNACDIAIGPDSPTGCITAEGRRQVRYIICHLYYLLAINYFDRRKPQVLNYVAPEICSQTASPHLFRGRQEISGAHIPRTKRPSIPIMNGRLNESREAMNLRLMKNRFSMRLRSSWPSL